MSNNINYNRIGSISHTVIAGEVKTSGYQTISNTGDLEAFTGATVAGIATQTNWELDITIDGGTVDKLANIDIDITDDWDTVAAAIETSLQAATSSTETVAIVDGEIKVTSATDGSSSDVLIEAGSAGTGSGDLLAAITALSDDYTATVDTAVDGVDGSAAIVVKDSGLPIDDFVFIVQILRSNVDVTSDAVVSFSTTTGILTVGDGASTYSLTADDEINVLCQLKK